MIAIYARFSPKPHKKSRTQAQHDEPIDVQLEACRRYCAHMNLDIGSEFCEPGVSGFKSRIHERPEGQRLLAAIDTGKYNGVVVMRLDRLSRETVDILTTTDQWNKQRITLHLASQGGCSINSSTPVGKLFLTLLASMGEFERGQIAERTSDAMRRQFHNTVQNRGQIPYGRRVSADGVTLEDDPQEQAVIGLVGDWSALDMTPSDIAARLNDQGFAARKCKPFYPQLVRKIIARLERVR